jgi:hypothetical protein
VKVNLTETITVEGGQDFIFEFASVNYEVQAAGGIDEYIAQMPDLHDDEEEEDDDGPGN